MLASLRSRDITVPSGKSSALVFDEVKAGPGKDIFYEQSIFGVLHPGWYHYDLTVCFVVDNKLDKQVGMLGSNVSIAIVPLHGGFETQCTYAHLQASQSSATTISSNLSVSLSGSFRACPDQLFQIVVTFTDPFASFIKIRASEFNPDKKNICTFVSLQQIAPFIPVCS